MNGRLGAQTRKSLADVFHRKAQSLAIVLAILIAVGGLTAVHVAEDSFTSAYEFSLKSQGSAQDVTVAIDRTEPALLMAIARIPNVALLQVSTKMDSQWHVAAAPGHVDLTVTGYADPRHVPLTPFQLIAGRYPGIGEIVMEYGDRGLQQFNIGDTVTVDTAHGSTPLRIVGVVRTPGTNPAISGKAVGYMSTTALDRLPAFTYVPGPVQRQPLRIQEISIRLHSPATYQTTVNALGPIVKAHGATVLAVIPPEHGEPVQQLRGILSLVSVLLAVALLLVITLLLNSVTALVVEQTAVIGTMKALGATQTRIVRGYSTTVLIYCLTATPLGIGLGVFLGGKLAELLATSIPLAPGPVVVSPAAVALGVAVGLAVPLLAALVPLWLGTRVSVKEALSAWGVASVESVDSSSAARFFSYRLDRVPQTVWLGLRGLFRKPWRATLSIVTIAIAATCFLVVQALATSVNSSIASVWGNFRADVEIYVAGQQSYHEISTLLRRVPNVGRIERVGWFGSQTAWGKISVWGVEPDSRIYQPQVTSGHWMSGRRSGEVLVSDDLAAVADLRTGSRLTLPGPGGNRTMTFTVIGTVHEPVDDISQTGAVVITVDDLYRLEGASALHIEDFTNRVLVQGADRSPAAVDRLTRAIDRVGRQAAIDKGGAAPVAEVFAFQDEVVRQQRNLLPVYALLFAVALIVASIGVLGLADALGASVVDRRRDIGLLRSLGATGRRIATVFWIEGAALSGLAWIIASVAGIPLSYLFVDLFRHTVMPTDFQFEPLALAVMVAVTLVLSTVATVVPAHRAAALHAGDLLRGE